MKNYFKIAVFSVLLMLFQHNSSAQQKKNLDSLLVENNLLVYNNPEQAVKNGIIYYNEAKGNPALQVSFLLTVANGYAILKNHEQVFEYALKAKSIADKNEDYVNQIKVLGFLGGQYQRLKLKDKASEYIDKAYEISNKYPLPDSLNYLKGNILFVKGLLQKDDLGCEYALKYFTDATVILKKYTNKKSTVAGLAIIFNNIGGCYLEGKDLKKSEANFNEALHFAKLVNSKKSISNSQIGLSEVLAAQNKNSEAIAKINLVMPLIEELDDISLKRDAYKCLSEIYLKENNPEKYDFYTKAYLSEEKKLIDLENKSLNNVVNEGAKENDQNQQIQKQNYLYLIGFIVVLLLVVIALIYHKLRLKREKVAKLKSSVEKGDKKE